MRFIGLDNFVDIFKDDIFGCPLKQYHHYVYRDRGTDPAWPPAGLALNRGLKGSSFFRTIGFLPVVISSVMVSLIWGMVYNTEYGMLNNLLGVLGLESWRRIGWAIRFGP